MPMFTPGMQPGMMDRRGLGQRLLASLIPRLQSFRFQAGQQQQQQPSLSQFGAPPMAGPARSLGAGLTGGANQQALRPSSAVGRPRPRLRPGDAAPMRQAVPPRPAGLTTGLQAPPTAAPAIASRQLGSIDSSEEMARMQSQQSIQAFLRMLAALRGFGEADSLGGGGFGTPGTEAAAMSADVGGDRGGFGSNIG